VKRYEAVVNSIRLIKLTTNNLAYLHRLTISILILRVKYLASPMALSYFSTFAITLP